MRGTSWVWRNRTSKAIKINHFVAVVELKDVTDAADRLEILISLWIEVMQRVLISRVTIGKREVDGHSQIDLTSTENILQE